MIKNINWLLRAKNGFDLVQALVVVVILGALATIAALTLLGQAGKGKAAAIKADTAGAVRAAKSIQVESGGAGQWATDIVTQVNIEVPSSWAQINSQAPGEPLEITVEKPGNEYGCQASINLFNGAVEYRAPENKIAACPGPLSS